LKFLFNFFARNIGGILPMFLPKTLCMSFANISQQEIESDTYNFSFLFYAKNIMKKLALYQ